MSDSHHMKSTTRRHSQNLSRAAAAKMQGKLEGLLEACVHSLADFKASAEHHTARAPLPSVTRN